MKKVFPFLSFAFILSLCFSSCDDYFETGIEGQWQMRKMIYPDGTESQVDSLYYLFKKDVFKYIKMENDLDSYFLFGMYKEEGEKLIITIDPETVFSNTFHDRCTDCMGWGEDVERSFTVKKKNSSELILQYVDTTYVFRKY